MKILVLGNGFDIAHQLPTRYMDFLQFVTLVHSSDTEGEAAGLNRKEAFMAWEDSGEFLELSKGNYWIDHFQRVGSALKPGWADFEAEMQRIIQRLDACELPLRLRQGPVHGAREALAFVLDYYCETGRMEIDEKKVYPVDRQMFDGLVEELLRDLNGLTRALEIYLDYTTRNSDVYPIPFFDDVPMDKVLSFNYTDTYQWMYDPDHRDPEKYDYIHGVVNPASLEAAYGSEAGSQMVLGIDEFSADENKIHDSCFIRFKKYFQRIHKGTGCKYKSWLQNMEVQENRVLIYGHSLDVTDKAVLKELITAPRTKTVIFHHSKNVFGDQIANLVKVLGKDTLVDFTCASHRRILFCGTEEMKAENPKLQDFLRG